MTYIKHGEAKTISCLQRAFLELNENSEPLSQINFKDLTDSMKAAQFLKQQGCYSTWCRSCRRESKPKN